MRGLVAVVALTVGCSGETTLDADARETEAGIAYLERDDHRRETLSRALVNRENGYARLRLAKYRDDVWGRLPIWNPRARSVTEADIGGNTPTAADSWEKLAVDRNPGDDTSLVALGREAFLRYPIQLVSFARVGLASDAAPEKYGLWRSQPEGSDARQIGGLVWVELPDGRADLAWTCSTCHASPRATLVGPEAPNAPSDLVLGKNNAHIAVGALIDDASQSGNRLTNLWGRGRFDPTSDGVDNPSAIPDLRSVRHNKHLNRAGTLRNGLVELAIRTETAIITSLGEAARPPRIVALAIAKFLRSLSVAPLRPHDEATRRGRALYARTCAGCHEAPDYSGEPVPLAEIGTDPTVGLSPERTTGRYKVPSLRGVGDRSPLLSNGAVRDVDEMFDPTRRRAPGHRFGLDLTERDRRDLVAFLRTL